MPINHNSRLALALAAAGLGVVSVQSSLAQTGPRDLAAQRFVLDDGTGNGFSLTLQVPVLTGNVTLNFPTALGTAYFILSNSVSGQTINGPLTLDGGTNLTLTNPLRAIDGGTGFDTYTTGDLLFANSTTTLQQLGIGTSGQMLISNGTTPNWSNSPTIIGGTIDNTPIGGTTPSTGTFTNLAVTGTTSLGDGVGSDGVTVNTNGGNLQLTVGGGVFSLSNSTGLNVATDGTLNDATGDFTINDALTQTGGGQVTFSGNVDANNGLDVGGANLTVGGTNFTVDVASGNTATSGTLTVASTTTLNGNAFIGNGNDDVAVNTGTGNFSVSNSTGLNVATNGTLSDATGNLTVNDNLDVTGSTALGDGAGTDNLTVTTNGGNISLAAAGGTFAVSNTTGLNVATDGTLSDATGTLTVNDDLSVTGNTTLGDAATDVITMNGAFDANDQGNVIGNNANAQQLLIDGVVGGTAELQLDGDADIDGNLNVDGATTLNGAATIGDGNDNVNINAGTGTFQLSSSGLDIATNGDLSDDGGAVTVADGFSQTGGAQVTFSGNVDAQNGVDVTGADLTVGGANFTVTVGSGNTAVGGTLTVTGATNLNGAANIGDGNDNVNINAGTGTFQLSSSGLDIATNGDLSDGGGAVTVADDLTINSAGGTDLTITETGVDRSNAADQTFAIDNSGAGGVRVLVNGATSVTNSRVAVANGHITSQQTTAPTTGTLGAGVASATLTRATDVAGLLNITTNGTPAAGAQATVTFNLTYGTVPVVVLTPANGNAVGPGAHVSATTGGFTVSFSGVPAASSSHQFNYVVIETQ
ncbi:MAG: S-layer family protein [Chlorobi bacterium]|nr:S-layer family protein [Chlorobiota bacterium]